MKKFLTFIVLTVFSIVVFAKEFDKQDVKSGFVFCLDNHIYYEEVGEGEPLILLHAGYLDGSMWDDQMLFFANNGFRVIRFDSYAHGKTIDGKNTPFLHELVKTLVDSLALGTVNLLGTSLGGVTIIEFAINHPEDISKMVLVSSGISGYDWSKDTLFMPNLRKQMEYITNKDTVNTAEIFLRSWFDGSYREAGSVQPEKRAHCKEIIVKRFQDHGLRKNALTSYPKAIQRYVEVKSETLILVGDQDMPSIHEISGFLKKGLENSQLIEIEGVGHMMNMEKPKVFNELVLGFLKNE